MSKKLPKPNYHKWKRATLAVSSLNLDPDNIRLDIEDKKESALINDLFENENAMEILESIITEGFRPTEPPVVIHEKNKYVVLDGNRRVSALKVLSDPTLLSSRELEIRELIKVNAPIQSEVDVYVVPTRQEAANYLGNIHTKNMRRKWKPLRQAYFYFAQVQEGKTVEQLQLEYPGVDIAKFLRLTNMHRIAKSIDYNSDKLDRKVQNARQFPITTLDRLLSDKKAQDFLGFSFSDEGDLKIHYKKDEFIKGYRKVVEDLVSGNIDSRVLNTDKQREKYLNKFPKESVPQKGKSSKITSSKDFKPKEKPATKPKGKRKYLAPNDILCTLPSPGVRRMLEELQEIDYNTFPNAAHDLLRSFLECALKSYLSERGVKPKTGSNNYVQLGNVLDSFLDHVKSNKEISQIVQTIKSRNAEVCFSNDYMNAINHNPNVFSTGKTVEDAWDSIERIFRWIFKEHDVLTKKIE